MGGGSGNGSCSSEASNGLKVKFSSFQVVKYSSFRFGRISAPFFSRRGPQPALKCPRRCDSVTRDGPVVLRAGAAETEMRLDAPAVAECHLGEPARGKTVEPERELQELRDTTRGVIFLFTTRDRRWE